MREHGEHPRIDRVRREESAELRPEDRSGARDDEHERGRDDHPHGKVPSWRLGRLFEGARRWDETDPDDRGGDAGRVQRE